MQNTFSKAKLITGAVASSLLSGCIVVPPRYYYVMPPQAAANVAPNSTPAPKTVPVPPLSNEDAQIKKIIDVYATGAQTGITTQCKVSSDTAANILKLTGRPVGINLKGTDPKAAVITWGQADARDPKKTVTTKYTMPDLQERLKADLDMVKGSTGISCATWAAKSSMEFAGVVLAVTQAFVNQFEIKKNKKSEPAAPATPKTPKTRPYGSEKIIEASV